MTQLPTEPWVTPGWRAPSVTEAGHAHQRRRRKPVARRRRVPFEYVFSYVAATSPTGRRRKWSRRNAPSMYSCTELRGSDTEVLCAHRPRAHVPRQQKRAQQHEHNKHRHRVQPPSLTHRHTHTHPCAQEPFVRAAPPLLALISARDCGSKPAGWGALPEMMSARARGMCARPGGVGLEEHGVRGD